MIASFDVVEGGLALCLAVAALICLFDRHLLRASGMFVVFALLMTLSWWRLNAGWLAVVEFVLGAVLTGACFFYALGALPVTAKPTPHYDYFRGPWPHGATRALLALAWCLMMGTAIYIVMPDMEHSPFEHPLVLVAVIIAATAMGAFALHRHLLRRLLAFNILGSSVFLLLAGVAGTEAGAKALISVGLAIAWLGSLLGALLIRKLSYLDDESLEAAP